jgi:zinc protease
LVEILRTPVFPAEELERLRKRILGALRREREDTSAQAYAALTRRLYPGGHPMCRRSVEDREAELEDLSCDELEAFHRETYGPGSLVLAVVGDVDADAAAHELGGRIRDWTGGGRTRGEFPTLGIRDRSPVRIHLADRPNLDFFLGHEGRLLRGDDDLAATLLANSCLGQSALTSRLGAEVRDREGLSYSVYSRFFGTLGLAGPWAVSCSVAGDNLDRAVELCREVVADFVAEGPDEAELEDERRAQAGAYQVGLATNGGIARELVTTMTAGEDVSRMDEYPARLLATTRDEVVEAIGKHIRPDELTLAVAGTLPESTGEPSPSK